MSGWWCRRQHAFAAALKGLVTVTQREVHFRIHLVGACLVVLAGWFSGIGAGQWVAVTVCIALVLAAESLNAAIEALADALHPQHHPLIGQAKDMAAAAVLVAAIASIVVAALIFVPLWW
jgi:diacylglycerol kinase